MKRLTLLLLLAVPLLGATPEERWVERTLRSLTVDEKVGQMLMSRSGPGSFRALDSDDLREVRRNITELHVGGLHGGIGDAATLAVTLNELQGLAKIPMLVSANLEGGAGYVLYGATRIPLAMAIAATGDEKLAYEAGRVAAQEGRAVGVNVNFYPVADVNNNPQNPIINIRSFGEDPAAVSRFVAAYVRGAQDHGQLATAKHFPGHGDVAVDSHLEMPTLDVGPERLEAVELPPFRAAVDAGVGAIMTAHIWLPRLESEKGLPATLSRPILTDLLRQALGFRGVVFTDSMGMRGVSAHFDPGDAALRAVEAGSDIVIGSPDVAAAFRSIREAVRSGRISEARLDESVRRILAAKASLGLHRRDGRFSDPAALMQKVGTAANRQLAQQIADRAITLVRDEQDVIPLRPRGQRVVQINILDSRGGWREGVPARVMTAELPKRFPGAVTVQIDDQSTPAEYAMVRRLAGLADALVVNGFARVASYRGSIDFNREQTRLIRDLAAMEKPLVYTAFGNPYILMHVPELPSYIVTYDISPVSEEAAVKAISGEIAFNGRLPIALPGLYPIGHGIHRSAR